MSLISKLHGAVIPPKRLVVVGGTNIDNVSFINGPLNVDGKNSAVYTAEGLGGGGANTAIAFSALSEIFQSHFQVVLCTKLGQNPDRQEVLDKFDAHGVMVIDALEGCTAGLPRNAVICHSGGRSIIKSCEFNYAAPSIAEARVQEIRQAVAAADMVFLQTKHARIAMIAAEAARDFSKKLVVDFSNKECPDSILENAQVAVLPAEFRFMHMAAEASSNDLLHYVGAKVPYTVVSDAATPSKRLLNGQYREVASLEVKTIDSLGAGDTRDAALCFFLMRQDNPDSALRKANIIASLSCERYGREWTKDLAERLKSFPEFSEDLEVSSVGVDQAAISNIQYAI